MMMLTATTTTDSDLTILRRQLATLIRKSDKAWALALCVTAPEHERNAASASALRLDWESGKVAAQINRALRLRR